MKKVKKFTFQVHFHVRAQGGGGDGGGGGGGGGDGERDKWLGGVDWGSGIIARIIAVEGKIQGNREK